MDRSSTENNEARATPAEASEQEGRRVHPGPSWGLMLFCIALAMGIAIAIAWAFVTPLLHRQ
jgi:hypothetical protein